MDDFLKFISNMEQVTAILGEFSRLIAAYHNGLVNSGVNPDQAVTLTQGFQAELINKIFDLIHLNKKLDEE